MTKPPRLSKSEIKRKKKEKEIAILRFLRQNARAKKAHIAQHLDIPPASMANLFKRTAKKYVTKYSSLLDFEKLGYFVGSFFIIRPSKDEKNKASLMKFLSANKNINTMSRTTTDELLVETHFKNMADFIEFKHFIGEFSEGVEEHELVSEVEKEKFLA